MNSWTQTFSTSDIKNDQLSVDSMSSKYATRLKAMEQARDKIEKLSKHDVFSFTFILSEEGPELMGEETLTTELMGLFEENDIIVLAKKTRMRG